MIHFELAHPHDLLVRHFLVNPELMSDVLDHYADSDVVRLLDLTKLRCESSINIDENLVESIGDLRFSTKFKQSDRESNVFLFFEHQSTIDNDIALRLLEYIVKSYREFANSDKNKGRKYPYPIAVLLYHGKTPLSCVLKMKEKIDCVPELEGDILDFFIIVIDLSLIPQAQLKGHPANQALFESLQLASEGRLDVGFDHVTDRLTAVKTDPRVGDWMHALVRYALAISKIGKETIIKSFTKILNEKEAQKMAMSTMQELILQGEAQGEAKGEAKGKAEAIRTFLKARFGKVPQVITKTVNSYADPSALDSLTKLAATCKSLDEFKKGLR
jgi:hypothetical protein